MTQNQFQNDIQHANELLQAEKTGNAYRAYRACLAQASAQQLTVSIEQLSTIWMGIGFCYAARERWNRALQWYHLSKMAVLSTPAFTPAPQPARLKKWQQHTPDGSITTLDHDAPVHALGEICEAIASAYENSGQTNHAKLYYEQSVKLYKRAERIAVEPETALEADDAASDVPVTSDRSHIPDIDSFELDPIPLGAIGSDDNTLTILQHFGIRRFGGTERKWNVTEGEIEFFAQESGEAATILGNTLHLFGQPERAVNVSFTMFACRLVVMEKRPFADHDQPVFVAISDETINAQADTLIDWLEAMDFQL